MFPEVPWVGRFDPQDVVRFPVPRRVQLKDYPIEHKVYALCNIRHPNVPRSRLSIAVATWTLEVHDQGKVVGRERQITDLHTCVLLFQHVKATLIEEGRE